MDVGRTLKVTAQRLPDKVALVCRERKVCFGELDQLTDSLAVGLRELGLVRGNRVAILLPNSVEFAVSYLAILRLGAIAMPLDPRLKERELEAILNNGEACILIAETSSQPLACSLSSRLSFLRHVVLAGGDPQGRISYESLVSRPPGSLPEETVEVEGTDEALCLYTSGTTGRPRGVVLTFDHLDCFSEAFETFFGSGQKDIFAIVLPMSHISGANVINLAILHGSTLVILDTIRPGSILEAVEKHRVNWFFGVPAIFQSLLKASLKDRYDTSSLRFIAMMGASVPLSLLREFQDRFPAVAVCQGYGMTETSPLITLVGPQEAASKMGSVGRPVPCIEVRVVDEAEHPLSHGQVGEVTVRGPQVMKGYHRDEEATAQVLRNGWLHTGDMGRQDEEGYLYLVGRKSDLIISGGLNVFPSEIEEVLLKHPEVTEAAVFGVPDFMRGEIIKAVVVPRAKTLASKQELIGYCRQHLADYKVPSEIEFRPDLPRTATGKIAKGQLI